MSQRVDPRIYLTPARLGATFVKGFKFPRHVQAFQANFLRLLSDSEYNRSIISCSVRSGKSYFHSILAAAWYVLTHPDNLTLLVSHGAALSEVFCKDVARIVKVAGQHIGIKVDENFDRASGFRLANHRGGVDAVGAGGSVTGRGYHLIVADDLVKDAADARSPVKRSSLFGWFCADLLTRLEPGGKIILVGSRRHMDDTTGRCLAMNAELEPRLQWNEIKFQAIDDLTGEALWPARYPLPVLLGIKRELELAAKSHEWGALYQQNPRSDPAACEYPDSYFTDVFYDELPPGLPIRYRIIATDPSKGARDPKAGDYACIMYIILDTRNHLWIQDCVMKQMPTTEVIENEAAMILKHKPNSAVQETVGFQDQLAVDVRKILDAAQCIIQLHGSETSENKEVKIRMAISEWFHRKAIHVRKTTANILGINQTKELFSGEHDDWPDTLAIGINYLNDMLR